MNRLVQYRLTFASVPSIMNRSVLQNGSEKMHKSDVMRFGAVLLIGLAGSLGAATSALAVAPQHHDQAPGYYRLKVGDLEVTALYDGAGAFDLHWLNGKKATIDGVAKALHEDPRLLDVADSGFLVNT